MARVPSSGSRNAHRCCRSHPVRELGRVVRDADHREAEVDRVRHPALREPARSGRNLGELVEGEEPVLSKLRPHQYERRQPGDLR